jgi:hypothetical protein
MNPSITIFVLAAALALPLGAQEQEGTRPTERPAAFQTRFERWQAYRDRAESRREAVRGTLLEWRKQAGPPPELSPERRAFLRRFAEWQRECAAAHPGRTGATPDQRGFDRGDLRRGPGARRAFDGDLGRFGDRAPISGSPRQGDDPTVRDGDNGFRRPEPGQLRGGFRRGLFDRSDRHPGGPTGRGARGSR